MSSPSDVLSEASRKFLFTENEVPFLPEDVVKNLKDFFRAGSWRSFIFRRVSKVSFQRSDMINVIYHEDPRTSYDIPVEDFRKSDFSEEEFERNLEIRYKRFSFLTSPAKLRENDLFSQQEIYASADCYADFDFQTLDFGETKVGLVPPRIGDLVCMLVRKPSNPRHGPRAAKWFTCSEQFLKTWTAVMYDQHISLEKKGKEPHLRNFLMSGNRLCTNSFQKWYYSHKHHKQAADEEEGKKRFFFLRTEYPSKKWVHLYCAIVLMVRYGELPCYLNVPANRGDGFYMLKWDIPEKFMCGLLKKSGYDPEKYHNMNWGGIVKMMTREPPTLPRAVTTKREKKNFSIETEEFPLLKESEEQSLPIPKVPEKSFASLAAAGATLVPHTPLPPPPPVEAEKPEPLPQPKKQKKGKKGRKIQGKKNGWEKVEQVVFVFPKKNSIGLEDGSGESWEDYKSSRAPKEKVLVSDIDLE